MLDNILLRQADLGGGQQPRGDGERPRGTRPVGAFVGPLGCGAPVDGLAECLPCHEAYDLEADDTDRGPLYAGPERRKDECASARWSAADRRVRPFTYAAEQEV